MNDVTFFNPKDIPLPGRWLIEASAGTGKTYNIANLYIRHVTGLGAPGDDELGPGLDVENILVVTFTRAATGELSARIRQRLEETAEVIRKAGRDEAYRSNDEFLQGLVDALRSMPDNALLAARQRLEAAALRMDAAAIHTIDSFSVQAVQSFLFETGALANLDVHDSLKDRKQAFLADIYRGFTLNQRDNQAFLRSLGIGSLEQFRQLAENAPKFRVNIKPLPGWESEGLEGVRCDHQALIVNAESRHAVLRVRFDQILADRTLKELETQINSEISENGPKFKSQSLVKFIRSRLEMDLPELIQAPGTSAGYFRDFLTLSEDDCTGPASHLLIEFRENFLASRSSAESAKTMLTLRLFQLLQEKDYTTQADELSLGDIKRLLRERLESDVHGDALRRALIRQYPACLVDEFQDTDPDQFGIFDRIYREGGEAEDSFFMIGDPKQSIYAFRGADIFSYLRVRREVESVKDKAGGIRSLDTNWRSTNALVGAVNRLFRVPADAADGTFQPFVYSDIPFVEVNSCEDEPHRQNRGELTADGETAPALVFVGNSDEDKNTLGEIKTRFARDTALRVAEMLGGDYQVGKDGVCRSVRPSDIALLVEDRFQADALKSALTSVGIRSIYLSENQSIFRQSPFAKDLFFIVKALADPYNARSVRTALATPLLNRLGYDMELQSSLANDDMRIAEEHERFGNLHDDWMRKGLLAALNRLFSDFHVLESVTQRPDCDRVMTDLRHLGELLQQADQELASPERLLDWYRARLLDPKERDSEERNLRLESDEELLKIVTIFSSKGLEYPVVFLPFFFMPRLPSENVRSSVFHPPSDNYAATIDPGQDEGTTREILEREKLAERLRLLYVAVTRARYQCVIGVAAAKNRSTPIFEFTPWAHLLNIESPEPSRDEIMTALESRLAGASVAYELTREGPAPTEETKAPMSTGPALREPPFKQAPKSHWQISSFSRLAHASGAESSIAWGQKADDEQADDGAGPVEVPEMEELLDRPQFALHGSARTGNCLHEIYEDYSNNTSDETFAELVRRKLDVYGLAEPPRTWQAGKEKWLAGMTAWLEAAMDTPLEPGSFTLRSLFDEQTVLPELVFDFSVGSAAETLTGQALQKALAGTPVEDWKPGFDEIHGLMTGAIDLTFVHENRVYILDYKSNTLGRHPDAYGQAGMDQCMKDSRYHLQYLVYTTALHRYLSHRFGGRYGYDGGSAELSFGGVYYLFLRGMGHGESEHRGKGIWFHRPDVGTIEALDACFGKPAEDAP